jgi:hypothetical protein
MNTLICGRMKEGKTTLALHLAHEWSKGVIAWDPRHRITGACYVNNADDLEDAIRDREWEKGTIVFRPNGMELEEQFDEMCDVLFTPVERFDHFVLVIDEASDLQSSNRISKRLSQAVRQHPRSVLIIQTTHSLQDWHRASKDLTSDVYTFRLRGRSLEALIDFCDGDSELEETIRNLPRHHCVRINLEATDGEEEEIILLDKPEDWYCPDAEVKEDGVNA